MTPAIAHLTPKQIAALRRKYRLFWLPVNPRRAS
jgi:hypothetical protein